MANSCCAPPFSQPLQPALSLPAIALIAGVFAARSLFGRPAETVATPEAAPLAENEKEALEALLAQRDKA